ncbi:MAG: ComF family protein [Cypionkella sp.]|nr:ComF family protein [Cypionkella sp.]
MGLQGILHAIYPPQCINCGDGVVSDFGLCADCWKGTPFISGTVCEACGAPLMRGEDAGAQHLHCDDCLTIARPWAAGRAALVYKDNARSMVLALKHGDRMDLARPAGDWLKRAASDILLPDMLVAPIPLHWTRLFKRRYNQAALLSARLAKLARLDHCPDLLTRARQTESQDGRGRDGRFVNVQGAFTPTPAEAARIAGRHILLVDDVMTSGATFSAATEACLAAGAKSVRIVALARVVKDA